MAEKQQTATNRPLNKEAINRPPSKEDFEANNSLPNRPPNKEDFEDEVFETTKWRDLPLGVWEIIQAKQVKTSFGLALILTVGNEQHEPRDVWTPERLKDRLQEQPNTKWILHEGLAASNKNPERQYFKFKLL